METFFKVITRITLKSVDLLSIKDALKDILTNGINFLATSCKLPPPDVSKLKFAVLSDYEPETPRMNIKLVAKRAKNNPKALFLTGLITCPDDNGKDNGMYMQVAYEPPTQ